MTARPLIADKNTKTLRTRRAASLGVGVVVVAAQAGTSAGGRWEYSFWLQPHRLLPCSTQPASCAAVCFCARPCLLSNIYIRLGPMQCARTQTLLRIHPRCTGYANWPSRIRPGRSSSTSARCSPLALSSAHDRPAAPRGAPHPRVDPVLPPERKLSCVCGALAGAAYVLCALT